MKIKCELSGIILAAVSGIYMLFLMLVRAFLPMVILPKFDILTILLLSLIALVLNYYFAKGRKRIYWQVALYAFLIFGIFPWVACFVPLLAAVKLAVMGAVTFTAAAFIFDSIINRLSSGSATKLAPIATAVGIYLAAQCLMGIF